TSRRSNSRLPTTLNARDQPPAEVSDQRVSGLTGAVQLAITPDGLAIRGWFRTQLLRHSNIKIIRIDEFRRYGRLVRLLEIETVSGGLLILSRWDLGTDPVEVLDALTAAGYAGRGQR
ncbi:PH domain-containing protein, partial [Mycobacterium tuberculosis]